MKRSALDRYRKLAEAEGQEPAPASDRREPARKTRTRGAAFAQSGEIIRIYSEVLDCEVLLAADNADPTVIAASGLPVYWAREFPHLVGLTPEGLRHVHEVRTFFDGELIE